MKYRVTLASYAICNWELMRTLPPIPGTEKEVVWNTHDGFGSQIWRRYLQLREEQKGQNISDVDWSKVRIKEDREAENEIHKFREAINIFMRFLVCGNRNTCTQVKEIELLSDKKPAKSKHWVFLIVTRSPEIISTDFFIFCPNSKKSLQSS